MRGTHWLVSRSVGGSSNPNPSHNLDQSASSSGLESLCRWISPSVCQPLPICTSALCCVAMRCPPPLPSFPFLLLLLINGITADVQIRGGRSGPSVSGDGGRGTATLEGERQPVSPRCHLPAASHLGPTNLRHLFIFLSNRIQKNQGDRRPVGVHSENVLRGAAADL